MLEIYVKLVKEGLRTIDSVPTKYKEEVVKILGLGNKQEEEL